MNKIDINEAVANMLQAIKGSVNEDWNLVKNTANSFFQTRKDRLELISNLRLSNQISQEFFEQTLDDEKKIVESELHAIAIISKVTAQNAANAAIDVLQNAVATALGL